MNLNPELIYVLIEVESYQTQQNKTKTQNY